MPAAEPRIFVNIASYRDTECQWTVKDLFDKAAEPDRVFVGICWQFVPGEDDDCFLEQTRPDQCRVAEFHAKDSRGVCWARRHSQKLWQGEEYTLQIDSHMRFVPEWDKVVLEMLDECASEKAILSTYPIPYEPPDKLSDDAIVTIKPKFFDKHRVLAFRSVAVAPKDSPPDPQPSAFCAAGLLFGPSAIIEDAPYDPHIYFQGEEITLAVRLWTRGWDIFSPSKVIAYHDYTNRADRVRHWKDEVDWATLNNLSVARVRHLLGVEQSADPEVFKDLDQFGLGTDRTLADYEAFSGVNFADQTIDGQPAAQPDEPEELPEAGRRSKVFSLIWEQNGWGAKESRSGAGAMLAQTAVIRESLPKLFDELDIEILGDAGCGDLNWMSEISTGLRIFLGFDVVAGLIRELQGKFADRPNHFFSVTDIVTDALPCCDAIFCRDCLTHLTPDEVQRTLAKFKESRSTYLVATTHPGGQNRDIKTGEWTPTDLGAAPYGLPPPARLISEELPNTQKSLGVWRLSEI